MTNEQTFKTNSKFKYVTYEPDADSWYFAFEDKTSFFLTTFWRLLHNNKIEMVSLDNGNQFGVPKLVDLVEMLTKILTGKSLLEIKVKQDTADLLLTLTDNIQIEIFISSTGYESYNFSLDNKNYYGLGSGDIAVFENK
ncbi:MAG: hypothetical protein JNL69_08960 [Bacteroidia bacterium]|nr:hypothetical protein [Bacteroidia bacterium]